MNEKASCKRVVIVDNNVSPEEVKLLAESGLTIKRVDSIETILSALANQDMNPSHPSTPNCAQDLTSRSEQRLKEVLESITDCYYMLDHDWRFVDANSKALDYLGLARIDLIGKSVWEAFPQVMGTELEIQFRNASAAGKPVHFETYFARADRWAEVHAYPSDTGLAVYFRNITARKRAEKRIRNLARFPMENPGPVLRFKSDHTLLFCNPASVALCAEWGCNIQRPVNAEVAQIIDEALSTKASIERDIRCGARIFSLKFSPVIEDNSVNVFGIDITERKQMEEALKKSEERFRALFACECVGIAASNVKGYIVESNAAFQKMLGYTQDELGKVHYSEYTHPDDFLDEKGLAKSLISGEQTSYQMEKRYIHKNGDIIWGRMTAAAVSDVNGNTTGGLCVIENISDRRKVEQELHQARALAERHAAELQSFVSSLAKGIALYDTDYNILLANESLKKLFNPPIGMPTEVWIRKYELRTLTDEPISCEHWPSLKTLRGEATVDARFRMVSPWNESIVSISGAPVKDSQGTVIGGALVFHDIADLIKFEELQENLFQREHHIAEMLQQALIPKQIPYRIGDFSIAGRYQAALEEAQVGGDFYDIFELGEDRIGILIGDVAGKGLTAAIRVAAAKHAIRSYAYLDLNPSDVMTLANHALCREDLACEDSMLTAFFAIVDLNDGSIIYTNGGHEPPIVYGNQRGIEELDAAGGIPLGIFDDVIYGEAEYQLRSGDTVLLLTDGITEARSTNIMYGKESVIELLNKNEFHSPEHTADSLLEAAVSHAGGHLQDDAAVVVVRFEGPKVSN